MSGIAFSDPVPLSGFTAPNSRKYNPLRDALRQLRDGGKRPEGGFTGSTMILTARALNKRGTLSESGVNASIVRLHFEDESKPFYAQAQQIPNVAKGTIRVALVTREMFEQLPPYRDAMAAAKAGQPIPPSIADAE